MIDERLTYDLISAIMDNNAEQVKNLLEQNADPNHALDAARVTPLHYAAQHNALTCIPLLIEAGASINARTQPDGQTPIEIALLHRYPQVVQLLMYYAQNPEAVIN